MSLNDGSGFWDFVGGFITGFAESWLDAVNDDE